MTAEGELEASAWIVYRWDCPACDNENELGIGLSVGESETCEGCGATVRITDAR